MWHIVHKETGKQIQINDTCTGFYQTRASVVRACKTSGVLRDLGLTWDQIELRDHWGRSMEERTAVDVQEGRYALRHREGWFWSHCGSLVVWYASGPAVDGAWKTGERKLAKLEGRKPYADPGRAGFVLVKGLAGGQLQEFPCRY